MNDEQVERLRRTVQAFQQSTRHRALDGFPTLAPIAREIGALLGQVELLRLQSVPSKKLADLTELTAEADDHVQFTINSHSPDDAFHHGVGRPQGLERNKANINSRRGQLEKLHQQIFDAVSPIIAHQQARFLRIAAAPSVTLDTERSISPERSGEMLWRYMPLRNLVRCERAGGLWLSSLERLRSWSTTGAISDVREGDIPPVVETLKSDYWTADAAGPEAMELLLERMP